MNLIFVKSIEKLSYSSLVNNKDNIRNDEQNESIKDNELNFPQEQLTVDCSKSIEVKKKERLNQCESFKMTSSRIKKIIIENYTSEEDDTKQNQRKSKDKLNTNKSEDKNNLNDINLRYSLQVKHHHSLSTVNQSPDIKSPYQRYSSCNNNSNYNNGIKNTKSNNNSSNNNNNKNNFPLQSVDSIPKHQEDRYRAKSLISFPKTIAKFEKLKRNMENNYQLNILKNSTGNQKQTGTVVNKKHDQNRHHQWDTLSSRIKANGLSKSKDSYCFSSTLKESTNYHIDSTISKKLFQEFKSINSNMNNHHIITNQNILTQAKPQQRSLMAKRTDSIDKTIQLKDKPLEEVKNEIKREQRITVIPKWKHPHFSKTFTAVSISKPFKSHNNKISYYKTDYANIEFTNYSFKSSFREKKQTDYSVLSLHIISNWGHKDKVGVTEIELYDDKDERIPVSKCHVFNANEDNINRVINNKTQTINDNDMWTSSLAPNIKINLYFYCDSSKISSVTIWNYNGKDISKGIQEIELIRKNSVCWKGVIPKGSFKLKNDYSYKIKLNPFSSIQNNKRHNNYDKNIYLSLSKIPHNYTINHSNTAHKYKSDFIINHVSASARNRLMNSNTTNCKSEEDKKVLSTSIGMSFGDFSYQKYITFNRLKIVFKENYGNREFIGITGLKLIDKNGNAFGVETASSVGALPKDISSVYNIDDPHIFENTFNNINETIDETNMWLTVLNPEPYLEICYDTQQTLSQLIIYNYNEPYSLDKCAKVIEVIIDNDTLLYHSVNNILLMKGIGSALGDYSQSITFPFIPQAYDQIIPSFDESNYGMWNNYISPLLPDGFWFKFAFISNHGDVDFIGLNAIEFFDSQGLLIIPTKIINDPEMKLSKGNYKDINNYWLINYYDFNKVKDDDALFEYNTITVIFEKIVSVSYIRIYNLVRNAKQGVKAFQIFCDDCLIFEGELPMSHRDKNDILNESDVLFINNEEIKSKNIIGKEVNTKLKCYNEVKFEKGFKLILEEYNYNNIK